jgi:hypothetical protein
MNGGALIAAVTLAELLSEPHAHSTAPAENNDTGREEVHPSRPVSSSSRWAADQAAIASSSPSVSASASRRMRRRCRRLRV